MKEIVPQDRRPPLLGRRPQIDSLSQVQDAVKLLAWFASRQQTVEAARDQSLALIRDQAAKELRVTVEGEPLTFAEYSAELETAIREYVATHPEPWAERRTMEFPAGTVALKRQPQRIELESQTPTEFAAAVDAEHGLAAKVVAWLKRQGLWPFCRLKLELNLSEIKRVYALGDITAEDLQRFGLRVVEAHDEVVVAPKVGGHIRD